VSSGSPLSITAFSGWCGSLPYRPAYDQCDPDDWKRRKVLGTATSKFEQGGALYERLGFSPVSEGERFPKCNGAAPGSLQTLPVPKGSNPSR
jgi:hypothetical protein